MSVADTLWSTNHRRRWLLVTYSSASLLLGYTNNKTIIKDQDFNIIWFEIYSRWPHFWQNNQELSRTLRYLFKTYSCDIFDITLGVCGIIWRKFSDRIQVIVNNWNSRILSRPSDTEFQKISRPNLVLRNFPGPGKKTKLFQALSIKALELSYSGKAITSIIIISSLSVTSSYATILLGHITHPARPPVTYKTKHEKSKNEMDNRQGSRQRCAAF